MLYVPRENPSLPRTQTPPFPSRIRLCLYNIPYCSIIELPIHISPYNISKLFMPPDITSRFLTAPVRAIRSSRRHSHSVSCQEPVRSLYVAWTTRNSRTFRTFRTSRTSRTFRTSRTSKTIRTISIIKIIRIIKIKF